MYQMHVWWEKSTPSSAVPFLGTPLSSPNLIWGIAMQDWAMNLLYTLIYSIYTVTADQAGLPNVYNIPSTAQELSQSVKQYQITIWYDMNTVA